MSASASPPWIRSTGAGVDQPAAQLLRVLVDRQPRCAVVRAAGEVDVLTGGLLEERIGEVLRSAPERVVLDLRSIDFLGASGLRVLVAARDAAERLGVSLRLVCTGRVVMVPLAVTGLLDEFAVYPDLATAVTAAAEPVACPVG